ncbi:hypothetical protein L2E82_49533, partial [Cichorium intybus]
DLASPLHHFTSRILRRSTYPTTTLASSPNRNHPPKTLADSSSAIPWSTQRNEVFFPPDGSSFSIVLTESFFFRFHQFSIL